MKNPREDFHVNTVLTLEMLDALRRYTPQTRFILLSSAAVYGNPASLPIKESARRQPISPYGFHKMQSEIIAEEFYTVYNIRTCSVRIFSAYGPDLRQQVLWDICRKAREGSVVSLSGTGNESRDFVHASDIAKGIAQVVPGAEFHGEAYNIASGREVRIRDLAGRLIVALGEDSELRFTGQPRLGDPLRWCADISRISQVGYHTTIRIEEGIDEYAAWFLAHEIEPTRKQK